MSDQKKMDLRTHCQDCNLKDLDNLQRNKIDKWMNIHTPLAIGYGLYQRYGTNTINCRSIIVGTSKGGQCRQLKLSSRLSTISTNSSSVSTISTSEMWSIVEKLKNQKHQNST